MRVFSNIALWGCIPMVLGLFMLMRNRRHAVLAAYLIGWEFLPMDSIKLPILELSKVTACSCGVLLAVCLFDFNRIISFRPKWYDIPMLVWCICPYITSIQNDLGAYDGASSMATQTLLWGLPYFIGRIYFYDFDGLRDLAMGIFIAALIYIPFCLYEIKMSPQLHKMIYGRFQHDFAQTQRWGGWRPMVFMQSGIALGMWMSVACMVGMWVWITGAVKHLWGMPIGFWVVVLLLVTVLCKSLSSLLFLAVGLGVLFWVQYLRNALPLYVLILAAPAYMYVRASGTWDGQNLIELATKSFGEDRAQSLGTRINAENLLTERAMDKSEHDPLYGWGKWSKYLEYAPWRVGHMVVKQNHETKEEVKLFKDDAPTDGMWVITLGTFGLLGLCSVTATILLPAILARKRIPLWGWAHPAAAPATVLAVILVLHMLDNLLNAMLNPIFVLAIGGISALGTRGTVPRAATRDHTSGGPFAGAGGGFPVLAGMRMPGMPADIANEWPLGGGDFVTPAQVGSMRTVPSRPGPVQGIPLQPAVVRRRASRASE